MNLGAIIALLKLAKDIEIGTPKFVRTFGPRPKTVSTEPTAKKITISIGKTPLILPEGFELVGPSRLGLRPKGL